MNIDMKNRVEELLKTYHQREQKIAVLRFELENFMQVSERENIGAMTFARGENIGHTPGHISNKTLRIALNYKEQTARMNMETVQEINEELSELEREQRRLCYYISLLDERQAQVVRLSFIEKRSKEDTARKMDLAPRTIQELKKQAVMALAEMYGYASGLRE